LEEERWAQADEAETEEERGRERKHQAALRAQEEGTRQRVLAYHHQQATNGLGSFQYELGKRYLNGDGVPQDKDLARHWLRSACTNGLSEATNLLGKVQ
jgi:TPR repeat protein